MNSDPAPMEPVYDLEVLTRKIGNESGLLVYVSSEGCSVCKVLKPRVNQVISEAYPRIKRYYVDTEKSPLIAGQFRVFAIPTILLFFDGKEHQRFSRNIALHQLEEAIEKPYGLLFDP